MVDSLAERYIADLEQRGVAFVSPRDVALMLRAVELSGKLNGATTALESLAPFIKTEEGRRHMQWMLSEMKKASNDALGAIR